MLTSDLLRVQRRGATITPRYLRAAAPIRKRVQPVAETLIETLKQARGQRRQQVEAALDAVAHHPADHQIFMGLRKLLLDRCELAVEEGIAPELIRACVFELSAAQRRQLEPGQQFDRSVVLAEAAEELELEAPAIEERLFGDLRANERLLRFRPLSATGLLDRYDVALAQGVLLRATRVSVALDGEAPGRLRQLFRAARFHGLLHRVLRHGEQGYVVQLDGPLSLFSAVQRYGIKLALFLPAVLRCRRWLLRADVLWGKQREATLFELGPDQGLVPRDKKITGVAPQLAKLVDDFRKLDSCWTVATNEQIFALPGEAVCVPDLVFCNTQTGEEVFLEAFGFWSRQAVWQRVETVSSGFPARLILCAGKQLRVSEELLDDETSAQLVVYKTTIRPKVILERLEASA